MLSSLWKEIKTQWCESYKVVNNRVCVQHRLRRNDCGCWADIHLLCLFPEGLGRQLSAFWRLVKNELMTGAAGPSFLLSFFSACPSLLWGQSAVASSIASTGSYSDSSEWLNSSTLLSLRNLLCLAVNPQMFSIPAPSLKARLSPHLYYRPPLHVDVLPLTDRDSPSGCVARHMAPSG